MSRRFVLLVLLLPVFSSGCATRKLWSDWEPDPQPLPVAIERGVRSGDGAFHVIARCHDDEVRRIIVRPFEPARPDWPDANRCGDDLVSIRDDEELPPGQPLRTEVDPAELAGEVVDDRPLIQLEAGTLRVQDRSGSWTLATFSPPGEAQPTSERLAIVALTPLALIADAATLPFQLVGRAVEGGPDHPEAEE